jgi:hypothetical protein
MPAYVIAHIDVKDPGRYEDYKRMSPISIEKYGGRSLPAAERRRFSKAHGSQSGWCCWSFRLSNAPVSGGHPTITRRRKRSARRHLRVTW